MIEKALKCDVLIIGAGPAGTSLAYYLAREGIGTILVDKKSEIEKPVRCAEYVHASLPGLFDIPISGIELKTEAMTTYIDYKESNTVKAPGLMLDRKAFTRALARSYIKKGGAFLNCSKAVSFSEKKDSLETVVDCKGKKVCISAQVTVGADGPNSVVGRYMGCMNNSFIAGLNESMPAESADKARTLVFFSSDIPGGYGWLFPRINRINMGIGCEAPRDRILEGLDLKGIYRAFKKRVFSMGLIKPVKPDSKIPAGNMTAGLIPSSGMVKGHVKDRFVLAGDAAGLANPITGAGIYNAVLSAYIVSGVIKKALQKKDISILKKIEEEYENCFSTSLARAKARREEYLTRWTEGVRSGKDFKRLIKDCWVSYRTYWQR